MQDAGTRRPNPPTPKPSLPPPPLRPQAPRPLPAPPTSNGECPPHDDFDDPIASW